MSASYEAALARGDPFPSPDEDARASLASTTPSALIHDAATTAFHAYATRRALPRAAALPAVRCSRQPSRAFVEGLKQSTRPKPVDLFAEGVVVPMRPNDALVGVVGGTKEMTEDSVAGGGSGNVDSADKVRPVNLFSKTN